jgi:hypothetical protein
MSPDTEPTDEELQVVMREALNLVLARKNNLMIGCEII